MLGEADSVVDFARSGRSFFPYLSRESGKLPHTCLAELWHSGYCAGQAPCGLAAPTDPPGALLPALLLWDLELSPFSLSP